MSPQNLQQEMEQVIQGLQTTPKLLLHSCCGPCSSAVLERLTPYFDVTLFYYNPNIAPAEEYGRRLEEQRGLLKRLLLPHPVEVMEGKYEPERFHKIVKGLEGEPEGGARCRRCFQMRLEEAVNAAEEQDCQYVATTLSVSPHKNAQLLAQILRESCRDRGVLPLPADFKKKGGYQRSLELSKEYGLYRQDYCGCVFSQRNGQKDI